MPLRGISRRAHNRFGLLPLKAKKSDSRYKQYVRRFGTVAVELDALPPDELRRRIWAAVERHRDPDEWERQERIEELELDTIQHLAERMGRIRFE